MLTRQLSFKALLAGLSLFSFAQACSCLNPKLDVAYPSCEADSDCQERPGYRCCLLAGVGDRCVPAGMCNDQTDAGGGSAQGGGSGGGGGGGGAAQGGGTQLPDAGHCDLSNCHGCCQSDGGCAMGFDAFACGGNGVACQVCPSPQTCVNGDSCSGCDSTNCSNGCCQNGMCQGNTSTVCGIGGNHCDDCSTHSDADRCGPAGQCVCGGTGHACESGQHCQGGQCVCDATSCQTGCCDGAGKCQSMSLSTCADPGAMCSACSMARADRCVMGDCLCGSDPECGAGYKCSSGACVCDPTSCAGCCSADGTACQAGDAGTACGMGGMTCQACPNGQTCLGSGMCSGCTAASCANGCCANGSCVGMPTATQCGKMASSCLDCTTRNADTCMNGSCMCGSNPPCAAGQHCSNGTCACDSTSCTGCCAGNLCVTNTTTGQCGQNGAMCTACDLRSDNCAAGGCQCGGSGPCAMGQQCVGGVCKCTSSSCMNGCCANNTCNTSSTMTCGTMGVTCRSCTLPAANQCGSSGQCQCGNGPPCNAGERCTGTGNAAQCVCDAPSCNGCCSNTSPSRCVSGNTSMQCGSHASCVACPSSAPNCMNGTCSCNGAMCAPGETCQQGQCVCDPTSCQGCCDNKSPSRCVGGTADPACGKGGDMCADCSPSTCVNQQCTGCSMGCSTMQCCDGIACVFPVWPRCGRGGSCADCNTTLTDSCDVNGNCVCASEGAPCPPGNACVNGKCQCAMDCNGCCDKTLSPPRCVAGDTLMACGTGGQNCVNCKPQFADNCSGGMCMCGFNPMCVDGQHCQGGSMLPPQGGGGGGSFGTCVCDGTSCSAPACCSGNNCLAPAGQTASACYSSQIAPSCQSCTPRTCNPGVGCNGGTGGGGAGTGGGSAGTGGGSAGFGGGAAGIGGGSSGNGGGSGAGGGLTLGCNLMNCASGCCLAGLCYQPQPQDLNCGFGAQTCQACLLPQHCVTGGMPPHCG